MNRKNFLRASSRLNRAEIHLREVYRLQQTLCVADFENAWSSFLTDINSVPEILKTASRGSPKAFQKISSEMKNIIRKDPTLAYLWHARGSDFHGLESGAEPKVEGAEYLGYDPNPSFNVKLLNEDGTTGWLNSGAIILSGDVKQFSFKYGLTAVNDQFGNTFLPPDEFLGAELLDKSPAGVGRVAAKYYQELVAGMSAFVSL